MKKAVFLLHDEHQDTTPAEEFEGEELVILLVADRSELAGSAEDALNGLSKKAEKIASLVQSTGRQARVILEWGSVKDALHACLQREQCPLLNQEDKE